MTDIILTIHVIIAIGLIIFILLQRSDGGALGGLGGGMSLSGIMGSQGSTSFLTKLTALFAGLFMLTSLILAIIESRSENEDSFITEDSENEIEAPLIKLDEEENVLVPPEAEGLPPEEKDLLS